MTADQPAKRRKLDFTNVREGSGISKTHMPEGDYLAKITKVTEGPNKSGTDDMWCFVFQLDERASATYPYYCVLNEANLWKLRNLLIAAGKQVPKKAVNVDPNNLVGAKVGLTLVDATYTPSDGGDVREQSEIDAVFPPSEMAETDAPAAADDPETDDLDESGDLDLDDL